MTLPKIFLQCSSIICCLILSNDDSFTKLEYEFLFCSCGGGGGCGFCFGTFLIITSGSESSSLDSCS